MGIEQDTGSPAKQESDAFASKQKRLRECMFTLIEAGLEFADNMEKIGQHNTISPWSQQVVQARKDYLKLSKEVTP